MVGVGRARTTRPMPLVGNEPGRHDEDAGVRSHGIDRIWIEPSTPRPSLIR
jgi:hypothetical protein